MATFKRIDDDLGDLDADRNRGSGGGGSSSAGGPAASKASSAFKRLDDDLGDLDADRKAVQPGAPEHEKTSSGTASLPVSPDSIIDDIMGGVEVPGGGGGKEPRSLDGPPALDAPPAAAGGDLGKRPRRGNRVPLIIAAVVIACAAVFGFLSFSGARGAGGSKGPAFNGKILYRSSVPDISVSVGGEAAVPESADGVFSIPVTEAGGYDVVFSAAGYESKKFRVDLNSSAVVADLGDVELKRSAPPSSLVFVCGEEGATVLIDGRDVTPKSMGTCSFGGLEPGEHEVVVRKRGFAPFSEKFSVSAEKGADLGRISLEVSKWRPIVIEVAPSSADVFINGEKIELTRENGVLTTEDMPPGVVDVEIKAPGHKSWRNEKFEVFSDIDNSIGPIFLKLEPKPDKKGPANGKK